MNKISSKELFTVLISLLTFSFPTFGTSLILQKANTSSILVLLLGFTISIIPFLIIMYISKQLKNKNIFEYNKEKFKILGTIINFLYAIGIFFLIFILSWTTINFTITQLLIRNSYYAIGIVYSVIIAIAVCKGKEVICRSSLILYFIYFTLLILGFILLIPEVNIDNLYPIISIETNSILKIALTIPTYFISPLIAILCIRRNDIVDEKNLNKTLVIAFIVGAIKTIIFYFFIISVYGIELSSLFIYPEYYLFKKINLFDFIQRVENIMATSFYISAFSGICFIIYYLKNYLKNAFKIKDKMKINITTVLITFAVPLSSVYLFTHYKVQFIIEKYHYFMIPLFITLFINFILILLKRDKC